MPVKKKVEQFDYDVAILGGGSAGFAALEGAKAAGAQKVCLIEEDRLGGDCAFHACTPTKALLRAAKFYHAIRSEAAHFGIETKSVRIDVKKMMKRKDAVIELMHAKGARLSAQAKALGADVVHGRGRFFDAHTLIIGAKTKVTAKSFVIATGARDREVSMEIASDVPVLRYRDVVEMKSLPSSVVIVGGGPIGCEFATYFSMLGVPVTLLQHGDHILPREDEEMAMLAEKVLRSHGVHVVTNANPLTAKWTRRRIAVTYQEGRKPRQTVLAGALMLAAGREPNLAGLGLEKLKAPKHIFYAGDAAGGLQFTHVAAHSGWIAGWNAANVSSAKKRQAMSGDVVPHVTFIDPEFASVGLTPKEAHEKGFAFTVVKTPVSGLGRAAIDGKRQGMLKVVVDDRTDRVLGAHLLCERAGEIIHAGITWTQMRTIVRAFPTYSEIVGL